MVAGDLVEFWSGEGRWKPATVAELVNFGPLNFCPCNSKLIRMHVGNGVYIMRPQEKVRYRGAATRYRKKCLATGRCERCGKPRSEKSKIYCDYHLKQQTEYYRERRGAKPRYEC